MEFGHSYWILRRATIRLHNFKRYSPRLLITFPVNRRKKGKLSLITNCWGRRKWLVSLHSLPTVKADYQTKDVFVSTKLCCVGRNIGQVYGMKFNALLPPWIREIYEQSGKIINVSCRSENSCSDLLYINRLEWKLYLKLCFQGVWKRLDSPTTSEEIFEWKWFCKRLHIRKWNSTLPTSRHRCTYITVGRFLSIKCWEMVPQCVHKMKH